MMRGKKWAPYRTRCWSTSAQKLESVLDVMLLAEACHRVETMPYFIDPALLVKNASQRPGPIDSEEA